MKHTTDTERDGTNYTPPAVGLTGEQSEHLAMLYETALESYRRLLTSIDTWKRSPIERMFQEYSRLKRWGSHRRAQLPASVPGSLAADLKDQPELARTVAQILEQIIRPLQIGMRD
jgi:hypothetical protein